MYFSDVWLCSNILEFGFLYDLGKIMQLLACSSIMVVNTKKSDICDRSLLQIFIFNKIKHLFLWILKRFFWWYVHYEAFLGSTVGLNWKSWWRVRGPTLDPSDLDIRVLCRGLAEHSVAIWTNCFWDVYYKPAVQLWSRLWEGEVNQLRGAKLGIVAHACQHSCSWDWARWGDRKWPSRQIRNLVMSGNG